MPDAAPWGDSLYAVLTVQHPSQQPCSQSRHVINRIYSLCLYMFYPKTIVFVFVSNTTWIQSPHPPLAAGGWWWMLRTRARWMCGLAKCEICKPEPGRWPGPGWRQVRLQCWAGSLAGESGERGGRVNVPGQAAAGYRDTLTTPTLFCRVFRNWELLNLCRAAWRCGVRGLA